MISITLPDGNIRKFNISPNGKQIAAQIGEGLAKAAIAMRVNGELVDLSSTIYKDSNVSILTKKDDESLELIRHDVAHILAEAVQELFPGTQVTIGPSIENGFYYDFAREEPFTLDDLKQIEVKMAEIIDRDDPFEKELWDRDYAIWVFEKKGEK